MGLVMKSFSLCIFILLAVTEKSMAGVFENKNFWGVTAEEESADKHAQKSEEEKREAEKQQIAAFCKTDFFKILNNKVAHGSSPLLELKYNGGSHLDYVFANPNDKNDPIKVKIENPKSIFKSPSYAKYHTVDKKNNTLTVNAKTFTLPEVFRATAPSSSKKSVSSDKSQKNAKTAEPTLRIITVSTSKGSLTYTVYNKDVISIFDNSTQSLMTRDEPQDSQEAKSTKAIANFNSVAGLVGGVETAMEICVPKPINPPGKKLPKEKSDSRQQAIQAFIKKSQETISLSLDKSELPTDKNGIVLNPCYKIKNSPFKHYYGFKVDLEGRLLKFEEPDRDPEVHWETSGNPTIFNTVAQFFKAKSITCKDPSGSKPGGKSNPK